MKVNSLGHRTELIFDRHDGTVTDKGDYLVVRTPSNPTYWWGNYLLFAAPPQAGDAARWLQLFAAELGAPPAVKHIAITWDTVTGETGVVQPFLDAGLELEKTVVLTAQTLKPPPRPNLTAEYRPLHTDEDWEAVLEMQVLCRDDDFEEASYRIFRKRKLAAYRQMINEGRGNWFGAYLDGTLVADLGVFFENDIARYQHVSTHPDYRRRGLCGSLVPGVFPHR